MLPNFPDTCPNRAECTPVQSSQSPNTVAYYSCTGCRHRWQWIDNSSSSDDFSQWHTDNPREYATRLSRCANMLRGSNVESSKWFSESCESTDSRYICKKGVSIAAIGVELFNIDRLYCIFVKHLYFRTMKIRPYHTGKIFLHTV